VCAGLGCRDVIREPSRVFQGPPGIYIFSIFSIRENKKRGKKIKESLLLYMYENKMAAVVYYYYYYTTSPSLCCCIISEM
jgi:hypothetical protein